MKLFWTTILRWDSETVLTNENHPKFLSISLVDVNMTELPQGLLSADSSKKFLETEVVQTNVTRLPDNLASIWPKGMILILENSQLQEFPSVLQFVEPMYLSLAKNNISVVPVQVLESISPVVLFLTGNPVELPPSKLTHIPGVGWLSLVATKVSFLLDWIDESYLSGAIVEAGGTPLCKRMAKMGLASKMEPLAEMGILGLDYSTGRIEVGVLGWYPPGEEEVRNPSYALLK